MSEMVPVTTVEQIDRLEAHVKDGGGLSKFGLLSLLTNYRETIVARDTAEARLGEAEANYLEMVTERDAVIVERDAAVAERDAPVAQKARPTAARATKA